MWNQTLVRSKGLYGQVAASFSGITWMNSFHLGKSLLLDALVEVALVALPVLADDRLGLLVGQVLDALLADPDGT